MAPGPEDDIVKPIKPKSGHLSSFFINISRLVGHTKGRRCCSYESRFLVQLQN